MRDDRPEIAAGAWHATVSRVAGARVYVEVPRLAPGRVFGPCDMLEFPGTAGVETDDTEPDPVVVGDHGAHTHGEHRHAAEAPAKRLKKGDRVLALFLEGNVERPVVVGRIGS